MMKLDYGLNILHVPYRGSAPAITALLAGEIQLFTDASTTILPHIQSGKARAIAVLTPKRIKPLPDVPTTAEQGYAKLQTDFWLGVVAPGGTPPAIIKKLNTALREALTAPQTRAQLANYGAEVAIDTPEEFGKMLARELTLWTGVAKAAHLQME
jgi:tripartite-type tricarboxylate transporter receptor subunit TctC